MGFSGTFLLMGHAGFYSSSRRSPSEHVCHLSGLRFLVRLPNTKKNEKLFLCIDN